ncbi:MAG: ATP-dependent sacrificial sulfur transferase LarE [Chthoniobacterales bacterium]
MQKNLSSDLTRSLELASEILHAHAPVMIAYSGGVDSSVLLALTHRCLGEKALGVIADSPSLPRQALREALAQAERIGARVEILNTQEMQNSDYAANPINRCYFCKAELFQSMDALARSREFSAIAYGENADDPAATRPGAVAAREFSVLAPLKSAGIGKAAVRELAQQWNLSSAELPAAPCLSSRIPYGTPVTSEALTLIEKAEESLKNFGFRILRVRYKLLVDPANKISQQHGANVQVAPAELPYAQARQSQIIACLRSLGFSEVEIDPLGYQGSLA